MADATDWSHTLAADPDGTYRVEIRDEDGAVLPVARGVSAGQAQRLIDKISAEAHETRRPIKVVIRDPYFMAATVITLKRQAL